MIKKLIIFLFSILSALVYSGISASKVSADIDIPSFPNCPTPGGTLLVSYPDGTHGIPGDSGTYTGSDSVFSINSNQNVQCYCATNGSGIQTNWWKLTSITQKDLDTMRNLGWIFIPDGSVWGLDPVAYLAKNDQINCNSQGGNTPGASGGSGSANFCSAEKPKAPTVISIEKNGSQATLSWTSVDNASHYVIFYGTQKDKWDYSVTNTGKVTTFTIGGLNPSTNYYFDVRAVNDCMPSDPAGIGGGEVLGVSTFAPTGTTLTLVATTLISILFFGLYFFSKSKVKSEN